MSLTLRTAPDRDDAATGAAASRPARERGGNASLRLMARIARLGGPRLCNLLLPPVALYFLLTSPTQRRHARDFQRRALGREPRFRDVWRQFHAFSAVLVDRLHFLTGRTDGFRFTVHGLDLLDARIAAGKGCVLLGAHLGSFEAMRALGASGCPVEVTALMYEGAATTANAFFAGLSEDRAASVIPLGQPDAMLRAKESLDRGGLVGLLADRMPPLSSGTACRTVTADFLGAPAAFPAGPHILAGVLGAPVLLAFALRTAPRTYEIRFEPFADRIALDRTNRAAALQTSVTRYADRLASLARAHPENWFNFHGFWDAA